MTVAFSLSLLEEAEEITTISRLMVLGKVLGWLRVLESSTVVVAFGKKKFIGFYQIARFLFYINRNKSLSLFPITKKIENG